MYIKEHIGQIPPSGLTSCHLYGHYEEVPIFNFILPEKEVHDNIDNALSALKGELIEFQLIQRGA